MIVRVIQRQRLLPTALTQGCDKTAQGNALGREIAKN